MSFFATRSSDWLAGLAAGCERLVHPAIRDLKVRAQDQRMIAVSLVGPFLLAGAASPFIASAFGPGIAMAAICMTFGAGWLAALATASRRGDRLAGPALLVFASGIVALMVALAGGLSSPATLAVSVLAVEAYWVNRSSKALAAGISAALAVVILQILFAPALSSLTSPVSVWHWLIPLAYAATVAPRLRGLLGVEQASDFGSDHITLEDVIDAAIFRIGRTGDVSGVSGRARDVLGLSPDLLLSTGLFDRIHVADRVAYLCALADVRDGGDNRTMDLRVRLPAAAETNGADNYREFSAEFMLAGGTDQTVLAVVRENRQLATLNAALAEAQNAVDGIEMAKSRFLAAVSHELRTPLNAIIGFSDMLVHEMFGGFADPRQKEYVNLIHQSGDHLLAVVNSILDVSKIESGAYAINPEPFRFLDAMDMCQSMMALQANAKSVSLGIKAAAGVGEIHADRRAVQQILINLISNAVKFTPAGGSVTMGAKRLGKRLHFWVADNGIGIAEDDLARLGQPFTQVQNDYTRQFEGTGLGLSLVKGLVALHDGTMSIESAPGEGTTVTISLPLDGPSSLRHNSGDDLAAMKIIRTEEATDGAFRKTA